MGAHYNKRFRRGDGIKEKLFFLRISPDVTIFIFLLLLLNLHIFGVGSGQNYIFFPDVLKSGEWWRIVTHPFVHVTWYHWLLDAGAFMILYMGLESQHMIRRIMYVVFCGAGSLGATLIFSPEINVQGLCGISGVAHGLMAVSALEMMGNRKDYQIGFFSLSALIFKCIYEVITGDVLFSFLQFKMCGIPLVACHAGGVAAGIGSFVFFQQVDTRINFRDH